MGRFELREVVAARDVDGIADGFARVLGREPGDLRPSVAHALRDNPHGSSGVLVTDPDGRVVAHLGVSHVPMQLKGEPHLFGRFYAGFVDEAYRSGGVHSLFRELDEAFRETFEQRDRLAAVFGQWDEVDWWYLRHQCGQQALATSIDLLRADDEPLPGRPGQFGIDLTNDPAGPAPARRHAVGDCAVRRDERFDAWRVAVPGTTDTGWQAWRGAELAGLAVTRERDGERWILDWALGAGDEEAGHALLRAVVGDASRPVRARFWTSHLLHLELFQEAGFRVVAGPETYLAVRTVLPGINHQWLAEEWHVTLADAGLAPLPRLTVGESIVYPPPPGTLDGRGSYGYS